MKTNMKCFIPVSLLGVGLACLGLSSLLEKAGVPGWLGMLVFLISFNYVLASKTNLEGRFWSVNGERSMVVMVLCEVVLLVAMLFVYMKKKLPKIK